MRDDRRPERTVSSASIVPVASGGRWVRSTLGTVQLQEAEILRKISGASPTLRILKRCVTFSPDIMVPKSWVSRSRKILGRGSPAAEFLVEAGCRTNQVMTPVITNAKSTHFQIASDLAMLVRVVHGSGKLSLLPPDGNPALTKA